MDHTTYTAAIAERLGSRGHPEAIPGMFRTILCELAKGRPASREHLAAALGWPLTRVDAALEQIPGIEYDDDRNIVGYGLTLRETAHAFEIDGRRLYTWCALDTLIFPALIGRTARVASHCPMTGMPISMTVGPDKLERVAPANPKVSLVMPGAEADIRRSFCCHVLFFASGEAADRWASQHEEAEVVSVDDAFRIGREIARRLSQSTASAAK